MGGPPAPGSLAEASINSTVSSLGASGSVASGGSGAPGPDRMPRKKIGGKIKLAYEAPRSSPAAKPFTDADEEALVVPEPRVHAPLVSAKSPQVRRRKE